LDAEKGMEVVGPKGEHRWLKNPWSVLAFQLAGVEGLKHLHPDGQDAERDSAPAEPLLKDLLGLPNREGLATLVLIDETLIYVRQKVGTDPVWRGRLIHFLQYLTHAPRQAGSSPVAVSPPASDPAKADHRAKHLT